MQGLQLPSFHMNNTESYFVCVKKIVKVDKEETDATLKLLKL